MHSDSQRSSGLHFNIKGVFRQDEIRDCRRLLLQDPESVRSIQIEASFERGGVLHLLADIAQHTFLKEFKLNSYSIDASQTALLLSRASASCGQLDSVGIMLRECPTSQRRAVQRLAGTMHDLICTGQLCEADVVLDDESTDVSELILRALLRAPGLRVLSYRGPLPQMDKLGPIDSDLDALVLHGSTTGDQGRALVASLVTSMRAGGEVEVRLEDPWMREAAIPCPTVRECCVAGSGEGPSHGSSADALPARGPSTAASAAVGLSSHAAETIASDIISGDRLGRKQEQGGVGWAESVSIVPSDLVDTVTGTIDPLALALSRSRAIHVRLSPLLDGFENLLIGLSHNPAV